MIWWKNIGELKLKQNNGAGKLEGLASIRCIFHHSSGTDCLDSPVDNRQMQKVLLQIES